MGVGASISEELEKPLDGSDVSGEGAAVAEVTRLRRLLLLRRRPTTGVMVDCGSGHTGIICYNIMTTPAANGIQYSSATVVQHAKLSVRNAEGGNFPLTEAFANNTTELFVSQLQRALAALDGGGFRPELLFVGATGGVRAAIRDGVVAEEQVAAFSTALHEVFDATIRVVNFEVLDGTLEARWELDAAQVIWGGKNAPGGGDGGSIGLFSGGGQSMQLGRPQEEPLSFPFSTMFPEFEERSGASPDAWLDADAWKRYEDTLVAKVAEEHSKRPLLEGSYVGTAMNHRAAMHSGIAGRALSCREAVSVLRTTLPQFRTKSGPLYDKMMAERKGGAAHSKYPLERITALHTLRLVTTLEMLFSPDAQFFFAKNGLGPDGNVLDCEWTLGAFLEEVEKS
jgi:hypothetical protein